MRRRRTNRATWFPSLPWNSGGEGGLIGHDASFDAYILGALPNGAPNCIAIPWLPDITFDPSDNSIAEGSTLRDFVEGQTCIIERVVGKIQWQTRQEVADTNDTAVCCSAIAILPVNNDAGNQGSPELPSTEWDPLAAANMHKPYLWRRTWVLANNATTRAPFYSAPASNAFFASRDDGPHVDTKGTKRAIRRGERLWVLHSVRQLSDGENEFGTFHEVVSDLRFIGRMVKSKNKGQFT